MTNMLPLLALAAAGAYVYTKKKKESTCPPRLVIDKEKVEPKFQKQAMEVVKMIQDDEGFSPEEAADKLFSVFAPLSCKQSDTLIVVGDDQVVASVLYDSLVMAFDKGMDIAEAFGGMMGSGSCPTNVVKDFNVFRSTAKSISETIKQGDDPIDISNKAFAFIAPLDCKWSLGTLITFDNAEGYLDGPVSAPQIYGAILADVLEHFAGSNLINEGDAQKIWGEFASQYKAKTGTDWVDPVGA